MEGRKIPIFGIRDIFVLALLLTMQFPALPSIIIFLIYVWITDEVFNKMLQSYRRCR